MNLIYKRTHIVIFIYIHIHVYIYLYTIVCLFLYLRVISSKHLFFHFQNCIKNIVPHFIANSKASLWIVVMMSYVV
jgi:hypothetical protein